MSFRYLATRVFRNRQAVANSVRSAGCALYMTCQPQSIALFTQLTIVVHARFFSESLQHSRQINEKNEGSFIFAQTAYKFDVRVLKGDDR